MNPMYIHSLSAVNAQYNRQGEAGVRSPENGRLIALEPDYKVYIPDAGLRRRMSRMVRMGVASALDCLGKVDKEQIGGIITSTGLGCLGDTEKFMNSLLDNQERLLNPTAFIQSTFNTIGAQIALWCKNHHYNMTYVHRGISFESALLDARLLFAEEEARQVLVGAVDELTETAFRIMQRMGFWRHIPAGEGAHFFVLGKEASEASRVMIRGVQTFPFLSSEHEIQKRLTRFLAEQECRPGDIDVLLHGGACPLVGSSACNRIDFKQYCGEYPTASAFAVWLGYNLLQGTGWGNIQPAQPGKVLIFNNYRNVSHSAILMEKA